MTLSSPGLPAWGTQAGCPPTAIARECGYADGVGSVGSYKKSELVAALLRHFEHAHAAAEPSQAQQKARDWLPPVMRFPAVDPDEQTAESEGDQPAEG